MLIALSFSNFSCLIQFLFLFFFFNDTATTEIYTLSLHDALPILHPCDLAHNHRRRQPQQRKPVLFTRVTSTYVAQNPARSEEHTSELQSQSNLVCRLLLEKKKKNKHKLPTRQHIAKTTP